MNIYVTGVNYKTTPLEIREKLSFNGLEQEQLLQSIRNRLKAVECVMLSTCNRTEVYVYTEQPDFDTASVEKLLCEIKDMDIYNLKKYFYAYRGTKAVRHLYEVACGLDSLVLGEDQILAQVKDAYEKALELGASSSILNTLFRDAITAAKRVKTETQLSKNSLSIGSVAVKLITSVFGGRLKEKAALVIGAGKIGSIALKNLKAAGIGKIYVTNRSHGKAEDLSKSFENVCTVDYLERYSVVDECDIVISSTSSPHYTITRDMLEKSMALKKERIFVDLAVPRDMDTDIRGLDGVRYVNIDHLQAEADENLDKRLSQALVAKELITGLVGEYQRWYEFRGVLPVVRDVQKYAEGVLNDKIAQTLSRLKCASDEDREIVKASIIATVNGILNKLVYNVRECANTEDMQAYFRCLSETLKTGEGQG